MKFKKAQRQQYLHNELNRHVPGVMKSHRSFCRQSSFLMRKVNKSSAVLSEISESLCSGITRGQRPIFDITRGHYEHPV